MIWSSASAGPTNTLLPAGGCTLLPRATMYAPRMLAAVAQESQQRCRFCTRARAPRSQSAGWREVRRSISSNASPAWHHTRSISTSHLPRAPLAPAEIAPSKRVIFSGIQPTGVPHLGNYLGALQNWVKLQDSQRAQDEMYLSIVGLHALTVPQKAAQLRQEKWDMLAAILAIGIHPDKTVVFFQEDMPQHLELAWILACCTSMGKLNRMTTWKGKLAALQSASESGEATITSSEASSLNLGLFSYPVLQAADILLYKATHVPVGEDQVQHLELARDLAETFNRHHATGQRYFAPPAHLITPTKRVLSLRDATQKMSKSSTDINSRILLTDEPEAIRKKLKGAVTDSERRISFDPEARRGVSNLLRICAALDESRDAHGWAELVNERGGGSGMLKSVTGDVVLAKLEGVQKEIKRIKGDKAYLEKVARDGAARARERAERTMREVREMVGF